jgi:hypothetical protein
MRDTFENIIHHNPSCSAKKHRLSAEINYAAKGLEHAVEESGSSKPSKEIVL